MSRNRPVQHGHFVMRLFLLAALLAAGLAHAEDTPTASADAESQTEGELSEEAIPEDPPLVRSARRLLQQIAAVTEGARDLQVQLKGAEGDDRRVIDKQIVTAKLEFLELTGRLVDNVVKQESEGLDTAEFREDTETFVVELSPAITDHLDAAETALAELRAEASVAPADSIVALEQKLSNETDWLHELYRAYIVNIEHRDQLGLPDQAQRSDLTARIEDATDREAGRMTLVIDDLAELRARAAAKTEEDGDNALLATAEIRRETVTNSLTSMIRYKEFLGLDATKEQQLIITSTGEVTSDIFKPKVAIGLAEDWLAGVRRWIQDNGPAFGFKLLLFVLIIALSRVVSMVLRRVLTRTLSASSGNKSVLLQTMLIALVSNAVMLIGLLFGLSQLGLELGPLLAGLGIAGFIIGFALQDSLANFAAGMMILGYRPYDVGDMVEVGGVFGQVSHMSLVSTTILTIDNQTLMVPNGKIWSDVIKNVTNQAERRVDMKFRASYADDIEHVERVLLAILDEHELVLAEPEPMVRVHELDDLGVLFVVRPWAKTGDYWDIYWDVTRKVKCRFDEEGITIPFPQRTLSVAADRSRVGDASA